MNDNLLKSPKVYKKSVEMLYVAVNYTYLLIIVDFNKYCY